MSFDSKTGAIKTNTNIYYFQFGQKFYQSSINIICATMMRDVGGFGVIGGLHTALIAPRSKMLCQKNYLFTTSSYWGHQNLSIINLEAHSSVNCIIYCYIKPNVTQMPLHSKFIHVNLKKRFVDLQAQTLA